MNSDGKAARPPCRLIAIGASTGGTEALRFLLARLPADSPPIVIVQHMPAAFTALFAERLNDRTELAVAEAVNGAPLLPGHALLAPGGHHTRVRRDGARFVVEVRDGPPVLRHRPSVDELFDSVAGAAGPEALGVLLTGMGRDGAAGLKRMHDVGAATIAQDEASCVVFGMPATAIAIGAVDYVLPLDAMPDRIVRLTRMARPQDRPATGL